MSGEFVVWGRWVCVKCVVNEIDVCVKRRLVLCVFCLKIVVGGRGE